MSGERFWGIGGVLSPLRKALPDPLFPGFVATRHWQISGATFASCTIPPMKICMGLASLLREKGVPPAKATERAAQALDRLGATAIQEAMQAKVPWKALKQLGNNCTPTFQFVLQSELAKSVQERAEGPDPPPRRKRAPKVRHEVSAAQVPRLCQVEDLAVSEGVFASEGRPLSQIDLASLGANSVGVVLVTPDQAEPYLRLGQPVSQGALALIVVGEVDCSLATVQVQQVRFRAKLSATGEPL